MKKVLSLITTVIMLVALFAGCSNDTPAESPSLGETPSVSTAAPNDPADDENSKVDVGNGLLLPLADEPTVLTMWHPMGANVASRYTSMAEIISNIEKEKRTGITIEYEHPAAGSEEETFRLLVVSQNFPDMIGGIDKATLIGGPDKHIDDGVFLELNDYLDTLLPNFKTYLDDPEIYKRAVTDSGRIPFTITIQRDLDGNVQPPWIGPMMRLDWLDDLGISTPQTYDDWHNALVRIKDEKNAEAPLMIYYTGFESAGHSFHAGYGVSDDFYNENGTIKYGFLEPGMKEYLTTMNQWYTEGLIDQNFYTNSDFLPSQEYIATGKTGAFYSMYTMPGVYKDISTDPNIHVGAVPFPRKDVNEKAHFSRVNDAVGRNLLAVTPTSDNIELCLKWIDYGFTEDGYLLNNYGILGESYEMVDGKPQFLPLIYDNPDGEPFGLMTDMYTDAKTGVYYIWSRENVAFTDEQLSAYDIWSDSNDGAWIRSIHLTMTDEEGQEYSTLYGDIQTLVQETAVKFITGDKPLSDYDSFVEQLKSMGIERCVELWQAAQTRFDNR